MRATAGYVSLILVLCLSAGCSTSNWSWRRHAPVAAKAPAQESSQDESKGGAEKSNPAKATESVAATPAPDKAATKPAEKPESTIAEKSPAPTKSDNPFQPSRPATSDVKPASVSETNGTSPRATVAAASADAGATSPLAASRTPADLNRELLLLIDRELQDATPAERMELFDQLKQVDSALVPEILRARRLMRQMAQQAASRAFETASPTTGFGSAPMASAPRASQDMLSTPRSATGWGNPWGQPAGANPAASDAFGVVQTSHASTSPGLGLVHADFTETPDARRSVEHAVHKAASGSQGAPLVLQNYEVGPSSESPNTTSPMSWTRPDADPRQLPPTTAQTASITWPQRTEPQPSSGFGGVVPFVVGLVPGRTSQSANMPAGVVTPTSAIVGDTTGFQSQLAQTTAYLEQEVAALAPGETPEAKAEFLRKHVSLRLLYLLGGHQERALTAIPGIPPAEQEFWQQLLWGMINSLDAEHISQAKDRATQTITQLNSAVRRLQEQADLQVRHVAFCRQILYYGNYETVPRNEFSPGQEVLLYAEIDNFKSEPTASGQYRTLLRSSIEILSPGGDLHKQIEFPATEDLCSTYRRDYFHNYQFRIPERMPLGPHLLKLTVFDELSGKLTSYSVNFLVN